MNSRIRALLIVAWCTGCSGDGETTGRHNDAPDAGDQAAPDGGSDLPAGKTCADTYVCYGACPAQDDGCLLACYEQEAPSARAQDDALDQCAAGSGCQVIECFQERCAAEIEACFGGATEPPPADATVRCDAVGIYTSCRDSVFCTDSTVVAFGFGRSAEEAGVQAVTSCTEQMTALIVIGNIGGDVSTKLPCSVTECNPL